MLLIIFSSIFFYYNIMSTIVPTHPHHRWTSTFPQPNTMQNRCEINVESILNQRWFINVDDQPGFNQSSMSDQCWVLLGRGTDPGPRWKDQDQSSAGRTRAPRDESGPRKTDQGPAGRSRARETDQGRTCRTTQGPATRRIDQGSEG